MKLHYVIFLIILASVSARGQATQPASDSHRRPRIGLALEGGGALGLAHIGVLEWLEKNHIPVDVIAGTSMGGLIGGVYAMGNSPQQIRDLVNEINWDQVLSGAVPFQDLSFRRKQDEVAYPNELSFGFHEGLQLPAGLTSGVQVGYILDREALPYSNLKSFDDLPIPFRCVATDLVSGKQVVFDRGSLPLALRSTMSVPGAFTPVAEGEHIYVDGSLVDNLPTDVVKAMGADIVIAVHFS